MRLTARQWSGESLQEKDLPYPSPGKPQRKAVQARALLIPIPLWAQNSQTFPLARSPLEPEQGEQKGGQGRAGAQPMERGQTSSVTPLGLSFPTSNKIGHHSLKV